MSRTREPVPEEVAVLYEALAEVFVAVFNKTQQLAPELVAIELLEPEGIKCERINPRVVGKMLAAPRGKEVLMTLVRCLLTEPGAVVSLVPEGFAPHVVVHAGEAWAVCCGDGDADLRNLPRSLADHPERREVIAISIHTRHGTRGGICPISGTGAERRATYQPLADGASGSMAMNHHANH